MLNIQIPNPKPQTNSSKPNIKFKEEFWSLGIPIWILFGPAFRGIGAWNLEIIAKQDFPLSH
jgi:hypothetical protein